MFRPKWKHSDSDVRLAAAQELEDMEILKEMAAKDRDWFVRHRVFDLVREKDAGDEVYAYIARNSTDEEIRRKAIKKLKDEKALEFIAKNDQFRYVRDAAEHRLDELRRNVYGEKSSGSSEKAQTPG